MAPEKIEVLYKISLIAVGIVGLFIPIIVAAIGVIFVRKNQKKKEEAEARIAEANAKMSETQLQKIQKEAKEVITGIINEPTIKDITEGYQNLVKNFKTQIEELQNENKRLRKDFNEEINLLKEEIEEMRQQNKVLKDDVSSRDNENKELKKKLDSFIRKTNKKNQKN